MDGPRPHRSLVAAAWPSVLLATVLALLVRRAAAPPPNVDTYFHLRLGREFLDGWVPWDPGALGSFGTADWHPTQWLSQVTMAAIESAAGLPGIAFLHGVLLCAFFATCYLVARRWSGPGSAAVLTTAAVAASYPFLTMRPQVVSYILLLVTTAAWLRAVERETPPWWLVPVTWFWAMCHGLWPVGVLVGACAVLGWAVADRPTRAQLLRWAGVPVLSAAAAALTPVGPGLYAAVLGVADRSEYFREWGSPDLTTVAGGVLVALLVVIAVVRPPTVAAGLLALVATGWAVYATRTMPVAVAMLVPLLSQAMQARRNGAAQASADVARGHERRVLAGLVATSVAVLAVAVPRTADDPLLDAAVDGPLASLPEGTPVLDEWAWGGYLLWRHPQLDLVMHGYGDAFTQAELRRNTTIRDVDPGWDRLVAETGARVAVLGTDSRLAYALRRAGWEETAGDRVLVLLEAPSRWPGAGEPTPPDLR